MYNLHQYGDKWWTATICSLWTSFLDYCDVNSMESHWRNSSLTKSTITSDDFGGWVRGGTFCNHHGFQYPISTSINYGTGSNWLLQQWRATALPSPNIVHCKCFVNQEGAWHHIFAVSPSLYFHSPGVKSWRKGCANGACYHHHHPFGSFSTRTSQCNQYGRRSTTTKCTQYTRT